jgi:ABC-type uncharacterized transport system permease subunit
VTTATSRSLLPFAIRTEQRLETPRWLPLLTTLGAVIVALVLSGVLIAVVGGDPILIGGHILQSSFGSAGVLSDTLVKATPLIFTGLACALAFRMRLWNIGAEGQLYMGAWAASAVVLVPLLPTDASPFVMLPLMLLAGVVGGALWGSLAGWLKARFNVNEIISTLMLNYIAILWVRFWVFGPWSEGGFQQSARFPRSAWLPRLTDFSAAFPDLGGLTTHLGFLLGLLSAFLVWFLLKRTRKGYEIRLVGDNPRAARYAGVDIGRTIILVMLMSGGLAGMAGMSEVSGSVHRLQDGISVGYGFTGVIIAYLARFNPFGVVIAAILFGALSLAGQQIQPAGIPAMIQGILLFCVICSDILLRRRVRVVRR